MTVVTITLNPCIDKTFFVERVIPDHKLAGYDVRDYPGGGGINVARVMTRLGGEARALWSQGGATGRLLARLLDAESVPHTPVPIDGDVRENLIITDASSGQQYRFGLPGPSLGDAERGRWLEAVQALPSSVRYVVVSGSLPGDTPLDWHDDLLRALPERALVILDTKKDALRRALDNIGVFLIKPNVHELAQLAGRELAGDEDIARTARELIERGGAQVVVVSLGRGGAMLVTADAIERFTAPCVPIRSRVGAGDSMVGGLVTALSREWPLSEAVRFGVAAGTATVMTTGTELCRRHDVERLYRSMSSQELFP